jgi:hypothetical protein
VRQGAGLPGTWCARCCSWACPPLGLDTRSAAAQPPNDPPNNPPSSGPFGSPIRTFIPFDEPDADFYSFEVSDLEVYNLEINTSGATIGIGSGTGNDDVLEIQGLTAGGFGLATPRTIGFGERVRVQATVGVPISGNAPRLDGIVPGESFAGVQINNAQSDPPKFVIGAAFPTENGTTIAGATQDGVFGQQLLPGVFAVDIVVDRRIDDFDGILKEGAGVRYRPAGSNEDFAILFDRYFQIEGEGSNQILPNVNGFQTTFGADRLGPGATMFIDDVITSGLGDPAAVPVTTSIDEAFDLEIEAFVKTAQSPADADRLIERAIDLLTAAEQQISLAGGFQSGSRTSDALMELSKAKKLDVEAREAIANNDPATANQALIDAATAKARAELFLEGHNPQSGPFPDGLGGFDAGDPIFADGFESGDVSAWSTGERRDTLDQPGCTPSSDTLCLGNEGRFRATVEWKDFSNNTGSRQVLDTSGDTGTFFFFNPGSPEVTVRLTDRCQYNNHFWVFYAGTTNVEYTLTVTDPNSDQTKSYFNPLGMPAAAITDTSAFATCP